MASLAEEDLDRVWTMAELAMRVRWSRRRMLRHLLRVNEQTGRMLLRNIGSRGRPRWTVTLRALVVAAPEWFPRSPELPRQQQSARVPDSGVELIADAELAAEVNELKDEVRHLRRQVQANYEIVASLVA